MSVEISKLLIERGRAGYAAIYLQTFEDQRALRETKKAAATLKRKVFFWTCGKGLLEDGKRTSERIENTENHLGVLDAISLLPPKAIVVLRNFHHFLEDPTGQALLMDVIPECKLSSKMIIIQSAKVSLPVELEKEFSLLEMPLPNEEDLTAVLDGILNSTTSLKEDQKPNAERRKQLVDAAKGLSTQEAENAFSLSYIEPKEEGKKTTDLWDPRVVMREKCEALRKTGILEYIKTDDAGLDSIGGMENLKDFIRLLQRGFTPAATAYGLPPPKGVLCVGPPGTGKTRVCKAIGSYLTMPLLKLDMSKLFSSLVGSTEANVRMAIRVAEAVAPCVLWADEIEKGFAGSGAGALDSGVSARVLQAFLIWLQEKTSPVYVVATANDVSQLPPELLRKGRFDELFGVAMPTKKERREILEIHLRLRNRAGLIGKDNPNKIDLDHFAGETSDGFNGAEIEAAIVQAMRMAFTNNRELSAVDLQDAFDSTQPLSRTMKEKLTALKAWCDARTRPANKQEATVSTSVGAPGRRVEA